MYVMYYYIQTRSKESGPHLNLTVFTLIKLKSVTEIYLRYKIFILSSLVHSKTKLDRDFSKKY